MTTTTTKRVPSGATAANTQRVATGEVQSDRYDSWGSSWRLGGTENPWGLTWVHRFARSVIGVTDRLATSTVTETSTKRVTI